ncbi:helix-turn-helix domain-containing protein [Desulforamulus aquiferis]|uniref:Helix-turn-helix transcriptional regulator n=1 Tax=Desulforamulus aquiferis TaxID=1397668 RepID=A0AAW7ZGJ0_9FIRM|nr:helix-turn-helix transcriptional regulator [Desulforamulus aquiferis]MDO7788813.1 helix-turn-helix transcriptional regulator [Desulforamulus aquiferis]
MDFSRTIKHVLVDKGLKASDLARMTGYSYQYVLDVLKGKRRWNETMIEKVCEVLDLKVKVVPKDTDIGAS